MLRPDFDETIRFRSMGTVGVPAACRCRVYRNDGSFVVVLSQLSPHDYEGPSVTNAIEHAAAAALDAAGIRGQGEVTWIEHYPAGTCCDAFDTFDLVTFRKPGRREPTWERIFQLHRVVDAEIMADLLPGSVAVPA